MTGGRAWFGDRFEAQRGQLRTVAYRMLGSVSDADSGVKADPLGPAMITFRDPDNIQWEFFEEA